MIVIRAVLDDVMVFLMMGAVMMERFLWCLYRDCVLLDNLCCRFLFIVLEGV